MRGTGARPRRLERDRHRFWCYYYEDELATRPDTRELVRRYGSRVAPPGERFIDSNVGMALAHLVIEEVSGRGNTEFMRSEVLDPLGLTHTAIIAAPYDDPGIARKYDRGRRLPFSDTGMRAAGSAWASACDLVRFGVFHLKDRLPEQEVILGDATIDQMFESVDTLRPFPGGPPERRDAARPTPNRPRAQPSGRGPHRAGVRGVGGVLLLPSVLGASGEGGGGTAGMRGRAPYLSIIHRYA